jgi:hypothetical protein
VKLGPRTGLADVAGTVARALGSARIRAVLTGGACASLYTRGRYESADLDFIIQNAVSSVRLDAAMAGIGFKRVGNQYEHPSARFFVEFPAGPLGIGGDWRIRPIRYKIRGAVVSALSATDSCRDRLAAFYHWNDRQALKVAVMIARRHRTNLETIRRWSEQEGALPKFAEFMTALRAGRRRRSKGRARKHARTGAVRRRRRR